MGREGVGVAGSGFVGVVGWGGAERGGMGRVGWGGVGWNGVGCVEIRLRRKGGSGWVGPRRDGVRWAR